MSLINFLFCGDVAPIRRYSNISDDQSIKLFSDVKELLDQSDFSLLNLESPLTDKKQKLKKSGPNISASPTFSSTLNKIGFNAVGLANNHIMDMGENGLIDTMDSLKKNEISYCGAGRNIEEAQKLLILEKNGLKIGIIAIAEIEFNVASGKKAGAAPLNAITNFYQIEKAKSEVDIVIISLHGGNEFFPYPRPNLRKICQFFIDLGVEAVICHHSHIAGAYEMHKSKPIIYSLGNFLFDDARNEDSFWNYGYMVMLKIDPINKIVESMEIIPYHQSISNPGIKLLHDEKKKVFMRKLLALNSNLLDSRKYTKIWKNFCMKSENNVLSLQYLPTNFFGISTLAKCIPISRFLVSKREIPTKLNLIRCDSHRELLISVLEQKM
ncbi:hypothetical protein NEF87_004304 [Candidatus Lokiarchaeum ossiferum]|uniref:Capsule synthesis protein CapA domain-containing protein n=1 Tax=Candidatus Lokiarchaeum ossiferum TaxID=2951803 RepID=A0ABY6HZM3_9ARCH|nr:hypothetical protein NEF87_004304 [Candidatus Lokiarchaeum sp. B-35]